MCGRFSLTTSVELLRDVFSLSELSSQLRPRFNISPSQKILVVMKDPGTESYHARELTWGLVPHWSREPKGVINARSETVEEKPSFRDPFRARRCLVLADGFYEWKRTADGSVPYYFSLENSAPFAFAGIWDRWTKGQPPLESCCLLTTTANEVVSPVHERMPVMLTPEAGQLWLSREASAAELRKLLVPYSCASMRSWEVSKIVNNPRNEDPQCREPAEEPVNSL